MNLFLVIVALKRLKAKIWKCFVYTISFIKIQTLLNSNVTTHFQTAGGTFIKMFLLDKSHLKEWSSILKNQFWKILINKRWNSFIHVTMYKMRQEKYIYFPCLFISWRKFFCLHLIPLFQLFTNFQFQSSYCYIPRHPIHIKPTWLVFSYLILMINHLLDSQHTYILLRCGIYNFIRHSLLLNVLISWKLELLINLIYLLNKV